MRVGIIGTGRIADKAATTLNGLTTCEAYAVGSRKLETAQAFAAKWGIKKAYGSYAELLADPDVDLVYVGTPHSHQPMPVRPKRLSTWLMSVVSSSQKPSGHAISLLSTSSATSLPTGVSVLQN